MLSTICDIMGLKIDMVSDFEVSYESFPKLLGASQKLLSEIGDLEVK